MLPIIHRTGLSHRHSLAQANFSQRQNHSTSSLALQIWAMCSLLSRSTSSSRHLQPMDTATTVTATDEGTAQRGGGAARQTELDIHTHNTPPTMTEENLKMTLQWWGCLYNGSQAGAGWG